MSLQLATANVIVLAHHFNPTITDQLWLARNFVVRENEMVPPFIFSDMLTQVQTSDFHLLIVPDKCQFTPAPALENAQPLITERVGIIVRELPHTPYTALGINFVWHFTQDDLDLNEVTKDLFFVPRKPLHHIFDVPDARFGAYLSKDSLGFRLKLDVKPVLGLRTDGSKIDLIQFECNYHRAIEESEEAVDVIIQSLTQWGSAHTEAREIVTAALEGIA